MNITELGYVATRNGEEQNSQEPPNSSSVNFGPFFVENTLQPRLLLVAWRGEDGG